MKISTQGIQPLPRRVRQIWMILHVACSVGWLGVLVADLALCLSALSTDDPTRAAALDTAVTSLSSTFFLPGTLLVLLTGVVLGMGTRWGLARFYWVLAKLVIALVLLAVANLATAVDPALLGLLTVLTSLATVLSILKPWGRVSWRRSPVLQEQP
ncbi:hypothetical protein [Actinophytocola sp.]|uniref:hypothetical protein n=1 Tax=Actinophytocola sp. TaxID=1872138 RepID=UPI003899FD41